MNVRVLFFAVTRDLAGVDEATLELASGAKIADFVGAIEARYEGLRGRMSHVRIARNERFARDDEALAEGDVLALVPPVAGG